MIIPTFHFLKEDQQLFIESLTGRKVVNGPGQYTTRPFEKVTRRQAEMLGPTHYILVRDILTGEVRNEIGPKLYFLTATEEVIDYKQAFPLRADQYVKLIDSRTGEVRVIRGEATVYTGPTETLLPCGTDGEVIAEGIDIDEHTAVLVRDIASGQLDLITEPQLFIPEADQEIVEVRKRIRLEDHQTVVIKDRAGRYIFRHGNDAERSFFLDPYSELVTLWWSSGLHKDRRNLSITHIDVRPKFMWYEFEVRTKDNVELVIGITFFWQIVDVEAMIHTTDDAPGDICSHARSTIIQAASQVTLETLLAEFNGIVRDAVLGQIDDFYTERGVKLHAIEVRSITCKDPGTQQTLQEIIQETTNRLNRLQKQESENEVKVKRLHGEIEAEQMRSQLLHSQRQNSRMEAQMVGEAEAEKVRAFLDGLSQNLSETERLAVFNTLRKNDALAALSKGNAQVYFTPADVNLSIESLPAKANGR